MQPTAKASSLLRRVPGTRGRGRRLSLGCGFLGEDRPSHEVQDEPGPVREGEDADRQPHDDGVDPEPARNARADTRHHAFVAAADQAPGEAGDRWSGR